jgi:F-type H+-transporting ATPase subunit k
LFGGSYLALGGSSSKKATQTPPINASSPDEADFIQYAIQAAEATKD